jgi:hypothetical protein
VIEAPVEDGARREKAQILDLPDVETPATEAEFLCGVEDLKGIHSAASCVEKPANAFEIEVSSVAEEHHGKTGCSAVCGGDLDHNRSTSVAPSPPATSVIGRDVVHEAGPARKTVHGRGDGGGSKGRSKGENKGARSSSKSAVPRMPGSSA